MYRSRSTVKLSYEIHVACLKYLPRCDALFKTIFVAFWGEFSRRLREFPVVIKVFICSYGSHLWMVLLSFVEALYRTIQERGPLLDEPGFNYQTRDQYYSPVDSREGKNVCVL